MVIKEMPTDIVKILELGMYDSPQGVGWLGWLMYIGLDNERRLGFFNLEGEYVPFAADSSVEITVKCSDGKQTQVTVYHDPFGKKEWKALRKQIIAEMGGQA